MQGSVAIQGAVGIGKSSLLSQLRMSMEGFQTSHKAVSAIAVGNKDVKTVDDAARLILESFADVDEKSKKIKFNFGKIVEIESAEVCRFFTAGRHLSGLIRLLEKKNMDMLFQGQELLILAIDEADKCAPPIARLVRALTTHLQQSGVKRVRFLMAGVSPYFQHMVDEDAGVNRFFYKVMSLAPMEQDDATELINTKLQTLVKTAEAIGLEIKIDPIVVDRIVGLSGGHPHILQLMGSHVVEHENNDPNGVIDVRDLTNSLRTICYEDRSHVYESVIHNLEIHGHTENMRLLLSAARNGFPTRIIQKSALRIAEKETIKWFVSNNILSMLDNGTYGLVDEFLRIRILLDEAEDEAAQVENRILNHGNMDDYDGAAIEHNTPYSLLAGSEADEDSEGDIPPAAPSPTWPSP